VNVSVTVPVFIVLVIVNGLYTRYIYAGVKLIQRCEANERMLVCQPTQSQMSYVSGFASINRKRT